MFHEVEVSAATDPAPHSNTATLCGESLWIAGDETSSELDETKRSSFIVIN